MLDVFVFPWWPRCTAHKTIMKALKGRRGTTTVHVLSVSAIVALWRSYTTWRSPWECFFPPIILGLLRPAKIGLASKGMTHRMTKLLCLSVRLGLYPTDICWLRLIQALEKPGIRVRHRWLFPLQFCLAQDSEGGAVFPNLHPVFTDSLKYNCLYRSIRNQRVFAYCTSVLLFYVICCRAVLHIFWSVLTQPIGD